MQCQHRHLEALAVALQGLRREADFRHQHQRLFATRQAGIDGAQVDLGLAATGDPVQQPGLEPAERADDLRHRRGLVGVRLRQGARRRRRGGRRGRRLHPVASLQGTPGGTPAIHGGRQVGLALRVTQQLGQARRFRVAPQASGAFAPGRVELPGLDPRRRRRLSGAQRGRQGGGQHFAEGAAVVVGRPAQRLPQLGGEQRRRVQALFGGFQIVPGPVGGSDLGHHPDQSAPAERRPHPAAHPRCVGLLAGRRQIVEKLRQG
jgi:hypothetical protein